MKIKKIKRLVYLNILIFLTILSIPLYQLRIDIFSVSISILTLNLIILCITLSCAHYTNLLVIFKKYPLLWSFAILFFLSFIPALLFEPTIHGLGVLVEWIAIPIVTSFLLFTHITKYPITLSWVQNALVTILFCVSFLSLLYLSYGYTTFDGRLAAFYSSPNHLAMLIAPLIFIAIANAYKARTKYTKLFSIITIILACTTLFFTNSFSSSAALLIFLTIVIFIKSKKRILIFSFGVLFILIFTFIGYHKISNINQDFNRSSLVSRYEIWTTSIDHLQQNTFINNSGIDEFQKIYLDAQPLYKPYLHWSAPTPHNLILTLWISGGFFTVLFFCLLCSRFLYLSLINYQKTKNTTALLYVAAFLTIIFTSTLDTQYWKNDLSILFWIILLIQLSK